MGRASLVAQMVKNPPAMRKNWVQSIPQRRAWQPTPVFLPGESPWTEAPGGLQFMGSQGVGLTWVAKHRLSTITGRGLGSAGKDLLLDQGDVSVDVFTWFFRLHMYILHMYIFIYRLHMYILHSSSDYIFSMYTFLCVCIYNIYAHIRVCVYVYIYIC